MIHNHKCPSLVCSHVWSHDDKDLRHLDEKAFNQAHSCPKCGRDQFHRYFKSKEEEQEFYKAYAQEKQNRFEYLKDKHHKGTATEDEECEYLGMLMELVFNL